MEEKTLVVANWKANKTTEEAIDWLRRLKQRLRSWPGLERVKIVLCPSFIALSPLKKVIGEWRLEICLGAQDISPFPAGSYTGEITGEMLAGLVDYVLVGHSERRKYFGEGEEMVKEKIRRAKEVGIVPIACITASSQLPEKGCLLVYEPTRAISQEGVYRPADPKKVSQVLSSWRKKLDQPTLRFLYGGSVNPENIASFLALEEVCGVVVGHASLDPETFFSLLENAV